MESHTIIQTTNTNGDIELPHALILEILSWMPTKSVCKFRSCSKFIYEFTNDAYFAMKHSKNSMLKDDSCFFVQTKILGFQDRQTETEIHALSGDHESSCGTVPSMFLHFLDKNFARIMASSNGLLLCMTTPERDPIQLFICNPITQSRSFIPMPCDLAVQKYEIDVAFAVECDVDVEDYRLLAVVHTKRPSASLGYKIYLPKEGVWKSRREFFGHRLMRSYFPVFCNGALHFLSYGDSFCYDPSILSYNLESDLSRRLNLPEESLISSDRVKFYEMDIFKWRKIGSSNESICLVKLVNDTVFTIWVLTNYESGYSWSKFLTISLQEMGLIKEEEEEEEPEMSVTKYKVMNGNYLVFATSSNVYRYDLIGEKETRVEKISDHGYMWGSIFTSYSQSLRSCGPGTISFNYF